MSEKKDVRSADEFWAKQESPENRRPHQIRYWKDRNGRWQYAVRAGNYVVIANSIKVGADDPAPLHENGYTTRRWALRKAKQQVPRGATYVLVQIKPPT